jgi:excisionase family DNA binding protein
MTVSDEPQEREAAPSWSPDKPLITREEAARRLGVGLNIIDRWSWEPGFPVIREGQHFVRIHADQLMDWVAERAAMSNRGPRPRRPRKAS